MMYPAVVRNLFFQKKYLTNITKPSDSSYLTGDKQVASVLSLFRGLAPKNMVKDSAETYLNHLYK